MELIRSLFNVASIATVAIQGRLYLYRVGQKQLDD